MIVLGLLEGYSRSISPVDLRDLVTSEFFSCDVVSRIKKSWLGKHQVKRYVEFVRANESPTNVLFLVGKSLGGRNIIRVFNQLDLTKFKATVLLTIDVNWPTFKDWTPNLNNVWVPLRNKPNMAVNIHLTTGNRRKQAGARVENAFNIGVGEPDVNHQSIVGTRAVRGNIKSMSDYVRGCHRRVDT